MDGGFSKLRFFDTKECVTTAGQTVSVIDLARNLDCEAQGITKPLHKAESWFDDSCERVYRG